MSRVAMWLFGALLFMSLFSCGDAPGVGEKSNESLDSLLLKGVKATERLDFENAHSNLTILLSRAEEQNNTRYIILANLNLGALYHHFNAQDEALRYFFQSLEVAEQTESNDFLNSIYNNIGIIYQQNGANDKALEYMQQALKISREQDELSRVGMNLINLGNTLEKTGQKYLALKRYAEAAEIFRNQGDSLNLSAAINNIGNIHFSTGKLDSASQHYRQAYSLSSTTEKAWYHWEYSLNLGKVLLEFGNLDSARHFLSKAAEGFESTDNTAMLIDAYQWLAKVERSAGNNNDAFDHLTQSSALQDTLLEKKTSKWISEIQMNFEFGKKEKELELLKEASKRRQTIWALAASGVLIIVVLLIITMRTKNQNLRQRNVILEQEQEVSKLSIEKNEAQRQRLEQEIKTTSQVNMLEKQKLQQKIEFKNRELLGKAMHLVNKNEAFSNLEKLLGGWKEKSEEEKEAALSEANKLFRSAKNMDQDWKTFKLHFEEVHPEFFSKLSEKFPELNVNDLRMCAYLTLNLSAKEIAQIFNITPESVRKRKQRLRQKLNVSSDQNLADLLRSMSHR